MTETQPHGQTPTGPVPTPPDPVTPATPADPPPPPSGPGSTQTEPSPASRGFFEHVRALGVRRSSDRWVAGVAGGLARRLGVDPLLIRAGLIALLVFGIGFLAYLIAWALLPDENDSIVAERAVRDGDGWGVFLLVVIALSVVGVGPLFSNADGWWSLLMTAALIGGTWWLVSRHRGAGPSPTTPGTPSPSPDSTGAPTGSWTTSATTATDAQGRPQPVWAPATTNPSGYEPRPSATPPRPAPAGTAYGAPKAPSAGFAGFLLVVGAAVVGYGLGQAIGATGGAPADLVAMLGATAAAGLATIVLGLLGRRSALTSLLSIVLAISLLGTWGVTSAPDGGGSKTWVPSLDSTTSTYAWNAGQATLDLREMTQRPEQREITASVSLGELVIYVPEDITTRIVSDAWLGGVTVDGEGAASVSESQEGPSMTAEHVFGDADEADLTVRANVRLGSIRIVTPTDPS